MAMDIVNIDIVKKIMFIFQRLDLTVQDVGICDVKSCIFLTCFVYMAIYDLEI